MDQGFDCWSVSSETHGARPFKKDIIFHLCWQNDSKSIHINKVKDEYKGEIGEGWKRFGIPGVGQKFCHHFLAKLSVSRLYQSRTWYNWCASYYLITSVFYITVLSILTCHAFFFALLKLPSHLRDELSSGLSFFTVIVTPPLYLL